MPKVPDWTPEKWEKWVKDKKYAEERVEHLEDELDKALDEQEKLSHEAEELRGERDSEKRLRVQAEHDARRAKAAADQAAAAAAAASRSLKIGEKQAVTGGKDGEVQELRVELQQLKAKNHGLNTQMDALAQDHERLAGLVTVADKEKTVADDEARELRVAISTLEREKEEIAADSRTKGAKWEALVASADAAKAEASRLEAQNHKLGDELDRLAGASAAKAASGNVSPKDLEAAVKGREEAVERASLAETQLSAVQTELRTAREELEASREEAGMRASAAREGLEAADKQTIAITEEANALRTELRAVKDNSATEAARREEDLQIMSVKVAEMEALKKEAEEKASASEARAAGLSTELSITQRTLEQKDSLGSIASAANEARDEEDTKDQVMEMVSLLKDAEAAKTQALNDLSAKTTELEEVRTDLSTKSAQLEEARADLAATAPQLAEVRGDLASKDEQLDALRGDASASTARVRELEEELENADRGHQANGDRGLGGSEANGDAYSAEKIATLQEELDDVHAMLDNVASERDAALNDLRRAGEGGGSGGGSGDGAQEEVERLRDECDQLRDQVTELENEQQDQEYRDPIAPESKRIKTLEAQVERLSEEHTRQSETWRDFTSQMEMEKEELSQELISAKLQVAQLFMEVDGLKLRHRQETVAATAAHAMELGNAVSPASTPPSTISAAPSPTSPHTMEL